MKKACLILIGLICGCMAGMLGLFTIAGIALFDIGMILLFGIPTALLVFVDYKIAKNLGWIKPKVKREKPVEEKVTIKEEKPVEEKVINIKDFKQEKEEKATVEPEPEPVKEKVKKEKPVKEKMNWLDKWEAKINEGNWFAIIGILLLWVVIIVGGIALAIWLIGVLISGIAAIIGFIFNAALYIVGFLIGLALISSFISFWWSLVVHEHIDKPRGIIRVKVKRRR